MYQCLQFGLGIWRTLCLESFSRTRSARGNQISVPNRRTTVREIVDSDCGAETVVDTSAELNAEVIYRHKPKLKVPIK